MQRSNQILLLQALMDCIRDTEKRKRTLPSGKPVRQSVILNYRHVAHLLQSFEEQTDSSYRILIQASASATSQKRENQYWQKFYHRFLNYLQVKLKLSDNTIAGIFKIIKLVFHYLEHNRGMPIGNYHHCLRYTALQQPPFVLSIQQVHKLLYDKHFFEKLTRKLKTIRDIAVWGCITGLRYADLMALKLSNLKSDNGVFFLELNTKKTSSTVIIPLPEECVDMRMKYAKAGHDFLLPRITCSNLNIMLKKLGKAAGWDWPLPKYRYYKGELREVKHKDGSAFRFYDHITCHTLRRTAISTLLMLGVPEQVVRTISGHSAGSRDFFRYVRLAQAYTNNHVSAAHEKLRSMNAERLEM